MPRATLRVPHPISSRLKMKWEVARGDEGLGTLRPRLLIISQEEGGGRSGGEPRVTLRTKLNGEDAIEATVADKRLMMKEFEMGLSELPREKRREEKIPPNTISRDIVIYVDLKNGLIEFDA